MVVGEKKKHILQTFIPAIWMHTHIKREMRVKKGHTDIPQELHSSDRACAEDTHLHTHTHTHTHIHTTQCTGAQFFMSDAKAIILRAKEPQPYDFRAVRCVCVYVCARVHAWVCLREEGKRGKSECAQSLNRVQTLSHVSGPPAEMSRCAFVICNIQYMSCM